MLVSGSGQQDRDETLFGHRPFLVLADRLARAGIAALRYDDRGVGGSGGDPESVTSADLATDAASAVAFLRNDARIGPARVGIIGHSEGGLIGPLVAAEDDGIAFVVLWAGPGVPGRELLPRQTELLMAASGAGRPLIEAQLSYERRFYEILAAEPDDDAAAAAIVAAAREDLPGLTDEQRTAWRFTTALMPAGRLERQAETITSPWFRFFLEHDPRDVLARLDCPVLGVWGGLDLQVEPAQNLPEVARALARAGNVHHALVTLPGLNHLLQPASTGMVTEYGRTETTIAPEALELMTSWIAGVVATPPAP